MRRGRGFSLAELLVGLALLGAVASIAFAAHRWLLLSSARSSRWLLARDRAERTVAFLDPRIAHCGAGLAACRGRGDLQRALGRGEAVAQAISGWDDRHRAIVIYRDAPTGPAPAPEEDGVITGTGIGVVWTRPSGIVLRSRGPATTLAPGEAMAFDVVAGGRHASSFRSGDARDLWSWGVLPMAGIPLQIVSLSSRETVLRLAEPVGGPVEIPPVDELSIIRCERFLVRKETLYLQGLEAGWHPPSGYPREDGILALWAELRPAGRTLDVWILASGGPAVFGASERPVAWPGAAPWEGGFSRHELAVARASWRLEGM